MPLYKRTLFCVPSSHLPENNAKFKEGEEYFRVRVTKELFSDYSYVLAVIIVHVNFVGSTLKQLRSTENVIGVAKLQEDQD